MPIRNRGIQEIIAEIENKISVATDARRIVMPVPKLLTHLPAEDVRSHVLEALSYRYTNPLYRIRNIRIQGHCLICEIGIVPLTSAL